MLHIVNAKAIRAARIALHCRAAGYTGCVCFSCGNASAAMKHTGLFTVAISPHGDLQTNKWWTPAGIRSVWPDFFDATSGHLSVPLMEDIAQDYRAKKNSDISLAIIEDEHEHIIPTGSGETLVCLKLAFPKAKFVALYDDRNPATTYNERAPLNQLVELLAERVIRRGVNGCNEDGK